MPGFEAPVISISHGTLKLGCSVSTPKIARRDLPGYGRIQAICFALADARNPVREEILHIALPCRLEIDEKRDRRGLSTAIRRRGPSAAEHELESLSED
jgi:hypothetical protein